MPPRRRAQRGLARLEFALAVAASGVLITLALTALSDLQLLGDAARRVSLSTEQSAASAAQTALRSAPCAHPVSPSTPQQGTAASPSASLRSCP
jgi:Tfp pilus assembly protein PilX